MKLDDPAALQPPHLGAQNSSASLPRPPLKAIEILVPLWGRSYIKQFLEFGLPSLLAPGNIPFLAKTLPCTLVFLTSREDAALLREHAACRYLASVCDIEMRFIDDLIALHNYSLAITMAYARTVAESGAQMLDTCFIFLIADYIIADGSLKNVLLRIQAGASAVQAGNFQVSKESASEDFYSHFDCGTPEFNLSASELMKWALPHLHPIVAANMVNLPLTRNVHANRLFWKVDEQTLLGRFYLMHMIGIRPEVPEFFVGSSCDYSFVNEMCPSGNFHIMTDSAEYLVVEMQPREHELLYLRVGPFQPAELADDLAEWTTSRHRTNALAKVVFRAGALPPNLASICAESDAFIQEVSDHLPREAQPFRGHPYWAAPVCHFSSSAGSSQGRDFAYPTAKHRLRSRPSWNFSSWNFSWDTGSFLATWKEWVFGRPPAVRPWHPRWPDYHMISRLMRPLRKRARGKILIVSWRPELFADWLGGSASDFSAIESDKLLYCNEQAYSVLEDEHEGCLLVITESELGRLGVYVERIYPLLKPNGFLLVLALNGEGVKIPPGFAAKLIAISPQYVDFATSSMKVAFMPMTWWRRTPLSLALDLQSGILRQPVLYWPLTAILGTVVLIGSLVGNLLGSRLSLERGRYMDFSSAAILVRSPNRRSPAPKFDSFYGLETYADRYYDALGAKAGSKVGTGAKVAARGPRAKAR